MHIKINTKILIEALVKLLPLSKSTPSFLILSCLALDVESETLKLTATDLDNWLVVSLPCQSLEDGSCCAPASFLSQSLFPDSETTSIEFEKGKLVVKGEHSRVCIPTQKRDEFPSLPVHAKPDHQLTDEFFEAIGRCEKAAHYGDTARPILRGIRIENGDMIATDGKRIHVYALENAPKPCTIHRNTLALVKLFDNSALFSSGENIAVSMDGILLIAKAIDGNYPNYKNVIPDDSKDRVTFSRDVLSDLIRCSKISDPNTSAVRVEADKKTLTLSSRIPDGSDVSITRPCRSTGKINMSLPCPQLIDAIRACNGEEVTIQSRDAGSPAKIVEGKLTIVIVKIRTE